MNGTESIPSPLRDAQCNEPRPQPDPRVLDTASLFAEGQNEVRLLHRGQEYRLRVTRQGKLILTK